MTNRHVDWSLGHPLDINFDKVDVVFHCASAAIGAHTDIKKAARLDVMGSRVLIEQCRSVARDRLAPFLFAFISSQSSSPDARNAYGRSKHAIEQMLGEPSEVIVRPGLVYDDVGTGVYGTALRLIRLFRFIPKFEIEPCIQPIHVQDLVACLERIAVLRPSGSLSLGSETPLDFAMFCRRVAEREGLPTPILVPWSGALLKELLPLFTRIGMLTNFRERVEGLIGGKSMDTSSSLATLAVRLRDF
jgi:nucleoside-diphosphate-sugar epimerase